MFKIPGKWSIFNLSSQDQLSEKVNFYNICYKFNDFDEKNLITDIYMLFPNFSQFVFCIPEKMPKLWPKVDFLTKTKAPKTAIILWTWPVIFYKPQNSILFIKIYIYIFFIYSFYIVKSRIINAQLRNSLSIRRKDN